jgi:hypothetical protein
MLKRELFVPEAHEFYRELRNHLHEEAGLLEILVQRLRISPDEDLYSYADEIEQMALRLRKIAGR